MKKNQSNEMIFIKVADGLLSPADPYTESAIDRRATGDVFHGYLARARNPKFLRKYFALLRLAFEQWEPAMPENLDWKYGAPEKNFEKFRGDLTIRCGYYTSTWDIGGRLTLEPKSIAFANMEESEFEDLYSKMVDVLLARIFSAGWSREDVDGAVDKIIRMVG